MIGLRGLARSLMAALFIQGGFNAWKNSAQLAGKAAKVTEPLEEMTTADVRTEQIVKANAGVQIAAGGLFALGVAPRVMSPPAAICTPALAFTSCSVRTSA